MTQAAADIISEFLRAMESAGVHLDTGSKGGPHPIADGQLHRADALGKTKKKNHHIWYVLHLDTPASGAFGDLALGVEDTWTAKRPAEMSAAERRALKTRIEETRKAREAERAAMAAAAADAAAAIMKETSKADPAHEYLARKGLPAFPGLRLLNKNVRYRIEEGETPRTAYAGNLIVPMFTPKAELVGCQMITPKGDKWFIRGTVKAGNYHSIGKPPAPGELIIIAEGYATGARLHEATGALVIVAFDANNLVEVGAAIRAKYPESKLLYAADNDRFTNEPIKNPGLTKAREAAEATGGLVAYPEFPSDDLDATDFDDLAQRSGLDAVRSVLDAVLNPPPADEALEKARGMGEQPPPYDHAPDGPGMDDLPDFRDGMPDPLEGFGLPHFRPLGIDGTTCFYQPCDVAQVISLAASSHKAENMMMLAPLQWWEAEFPGSKEGVDWKAAVNACIRACKARRKFIPHNAVRGRGAWFEGETPIYHAGDHLVIEGQRVPISAHSSRFVYDEGETIPVAVDDPASTGEARQFLNLCKSLRWASSLSGYMLAGWCVVAPVCGFLKWRPHIWINGPAGAGKSTVMDKIVKAALSTTAHSVVGNTTEAGIRATLGMDALPIIFDESEPKDMQSQSRIRSILDLARVAASESDGLILKGTSNQGTKGYRARSMFVFASINTQIEGYADETRFTQLTLAAPSAETETEKAAAKAHYEKLVSDMVALFTPAFAKRLLARTILNLPRLREYVAVFTAAATLHLGAQRLGDQVGPMLAGAYLLNTTKPLTVEDALKWIRANDWADHSARAATTDIQRFIQHVTGFTVRHNTPEGGVWERTIGELIDIAAHEPERITEGLDRVDNKKRSSAVAALARIGIRVDMDANEQTVVEMTTSYEGFKRGVLRGTEWAGTNIRNLLKDIPGAVMPKGNRYFASGVNTPFVVLPITALLGEREPGETG